MARLPAQPLEVLSNKIHVGRPGGEYGTHAHICPLWSPRTRPSAPSAGRRTGEPDPSPTDPAFCSAWSIGSRLTSTPADHFQLLARLLLRPRAGWVPGALFGVGTMPTQVLFGLGVGAWMARRHLPPEAL